MKNKTNCFIYAVYRTRLNPVQDSVYRRWQILLISSHARLYVIWYLNLSSVHVCVCIYKPMIFCWIPAWRSAYCNLCSAHGTASLFWTPATKRCLYDCRTWVNKIHTPAQLTFKCLSGFVLLWVTARQFFFIPSSKLHLNIKSHLWKSMHVFLLGVGLQAFRTCCEASCLDFWERWISDYDHGFVLEHVNFCVLAGVT